jgi:hypothetical protein
MTCEPYPEYAKKCSKCGSFDIVRKIEGIIEHRECEVSYRCGVCGEYVAYWAYGYYDPIFDPNQKKDIEEEEMRLELKYKMNWFDDEEALSRIKL